MRSYFAPGKIMLTGEYLVMNGFDSFAFPTKMGQWLDVYEFDTPDELSDFIVFQAKDFQDNVWFETKLLLPDFQPIEIHHVENILVNRLCGIFKLAENDFWTSGRSFRLETRLEFNRVWGLGSSSTLVKLMSDFLNVDPFKIQFEIFGGSGYDVAIAKLQKPLLYWLTSDEMNWNYWKLNAELTEKWFVVFYGKKMDSRSSLANVQDELNQIAEDDFYTAQFDKILNNTKVATDLISLESSLEMYQMLLSQSLMLPTPYELLGIKPTNKGLCKWLGAWGGDMILINETILQTYPSAFENFEMMPWNDLVINE